MRPTLTARERAHLKARAHALEPVVQLGTAGVTDGVVTEVDRALSALELIKVRIAGDRHERVASGDALCARTGATAVHRVGKVLILWRPRPADVHRPPSTEESVTPDMIAASGRRETPMENTLVRSSPCPECGAEMIWTQNAWKTGDTGRAAYRCLSGHAVDPSTTRQCPSCGIHDTVLAGEHEGRPQSRCTRCQTLFDVPA